MHADIVVKTILLGLLATSGWVAIVAWVTGSTLRRVNTAADAFEDRFWSGGSLDELFDREGSDPGHPMAVVFAAAIGEWRRSLSVLGVAINHGRVHRRIEQVTAVAVRREMDRLAHRIVILESVVASAPLIGLFGMVCGVIGSAPAVAAMPGVSLADVFSGLAAPLLAAATGLFTAALAVLARQVASAGLARFVGRLEAFRVEFAVLLSRQGEVAAAAPPG